MKKTALFLSTVALLPGFAAAQGAFSDLSGEALLAELETQGYDLTELADASGEVEVSVMIDGVAIEVEIDLASGDITDIDMEDDADDDDHDDDDDEDDDDDDDDEDEGDENED